MTDHANIPLSSLTPMMQQYFRLKEQAMGAILFFRMGDFFEIFGDDAEQVAPLLQLVLTSRERGDQQKIPFCGVPHHSAKHYWTKLLQNGWKIAIAEQVEDPKAAKGLVERAIVKILTPGAIDDLEGLPTDQPNYLMTCYEDPANRKWHLVLADISTGELRCGTAATFSEAFADVERYKPRQLLARQAFAKELKEKLAEAPHPQSILVEPLPESPLRDPSIQRTVIGSVFGVDAKDSLSSALNGADPAALAATFTYFNHLKISLKPFLSVRPLKSAETMVMSETVMRDLELFATSRRGDVRGSLMHAINHTKTPMGARLLRRSLAEPLVKSAAIFARTEATSSLVKTDRRHLEAMRTILGQTSDLARLVSRLTSGSIAPGQLVLIRSSLEAAHKLHGLLSSDDTVLGSQLIRAQLLKLTCSSEILTMLKNCIADEPGALGSDQPIFRSGLNPELDRLNKLAESGWQQMRAYEAQLRAETGISSLKIKAHKNFGHLIEVTKANQKKVPDDFIRKQTMVNGERYITESLLDLDEQVSQAAARARELEQKMYDDLVRELATKISHLQESSEAVSILDLLQSFAWLAINADYVRPEIAPSRHLELRGSRHPVVERIIGRDRFHPNDVVLTGGTDVLLITGPNMGGKSTVMRQVAITALLHQIGCFVPATKAFLPVFDQIHTRVGASDDLARGRSTFMMEMMESAEILRQSSPDSLVILDEVGRGTSTQDGLALAGAILEDLSQRVGCLAFFATHYHELVQLACDLRNVSVMQMEFKDLQQEMRFTHRLIAGASGRSFGLEVARQAGLPTKIIERAKELLVQERVENPATAQFQQAEITVEPLMAGQHAVLDKLRSLRIQATTPLQALNILHDLRQLLDSPRRDQTPLFGDP